MMPRLSVIVPTIRLGGLDILISGLEQQTFKDFELIIVDCIYKYRKDIITERLREASFPIKHVEPFNNRFPTNSYSHTVNTGIAYAEGKVSVITCDHVWFDPNSLELHSNHHKRFPNSALMGIYKHAEWPKVHPDFPKRYGPWEHLKLDHNGGRADQIIFEICNKWMDNFVEDLDKPGLEQFMWSVLEKTFTTDDNLYEGSRDEPCQMFPNGLTQPQNCDLKNESFPTEALLSINGLDEDFDGSHGWQDSEVAERLTLHRGMDWYAQPENVVYKINSHFILNARRMNQVMSHNEGIFYSKRAAGYPPVNSWDIREVRSGLIPGGK